MTMPAQRPVNCDEDFEDDLQRRWLMTMPAQRPVNCDRRMRSPWFLSFRVTMPAQRLVNCDSQPPADYGNEDEHDDACAEAGELRRSR